MAFLLLIPFFLVRFGLMALLNLEALPRAAHFPPLAGGEAAAYWVYQFSTAVLILYPIFLRIKTVPPALFSAGTVIYLLGIILLAGAAVNFSFPSETGVNQNGLYSISRNPMYVAYFFVFLGCALLAQSPVLSAALFCFQFSAHWIIRAEERWCIQEFGDTYVQYMKRVRRYI